MKNSSNEFRGKNNKEYKKNSDFDYYQKSTNRSKKNDKFFIRGVFHRFNSFLFLNIQKVLIIFEDLLKIASQ